MRYPDPYRKVVIVRRKDQTFIINVIKSLYHAGTAGHIDKKKEKETFHSGIELKYNRSCAIIFEVI